MRILITGGTGLIGQHFIREHQSYHYTVLSRDIAKVEKLGPNCTGISGLSCLQNLNEFDAVINLAGEPIIDKRWSDTQKEIICQSRWGITEQLVILFAASDFPPSVFISGSAIGYYGNSFGQPMLEDSATAESDFSSDLCQRWESIAEKASGTTRVVSIRTGVVLAQDGGALKKMLLPFRFWLGAQLGNGQQIMSWIHINDQIRAINFLLNDSSAQGAYNLTAPEPITNKLFSQTLAKHLHSKCFLAVPDKVLRILMGESAALLLNSQNILPQKLLDSGFHFEFSKIDSAFTDLV